MTPETRGKTSPRSWLSSAARQPLVHFLLLGAVVFAVERITHRDDALTIVVTPEVRENEAARLQQSLGREASPRELDEALNAWVQNEALYREGLRLGLDRHDPQVRRQVIENLRELEEKSEILPSPTEDDLKKWIDDHVGQYEEPVRYDLEVLEFSNDEAGAEQARAALDVLSGSSSVPENPAMKRLLARSGEYLKRAYGDPFFDQVETSTEDEWFLASSQRATWVARVFRRRGGPLPRERIEERARKDLHNHRSKLAREARESRLVRKYRVVRKDSP